MTELAYTPIPQRFVGHSGIRPPLLPLLGRVISLLPVGAPKPNVDGDVELIDGVQITHRFVDVPGESEKIRWHFVEAGAGEPVVFIHGVPDSWYMWKSQIAAIAGTHRAIAIDLKGYGQSHKGAGDYRQEGVAEQLIALFDVLGLDRVNLVTHDRGTVVADYLAANHPRRVSRYVRGEQHLYHFNPLLAPQESIFLDPLRSHILDMPRMIVAGAYAALARRPVPREELFRTTQEFSHPGIGPAVRRYFNSSSFRKEWIDRRTRLIDAWRFPVLVLQGHDDPKQPREFYVDIERHMPDARVAFIDAGHFYPLENPEQTTRMIREFLGETRARMTA